MFDISFGQILLVLIIGLVVLGPERLPVAIKAIAKWIAALRRMSASVQLELNKELKLQEIQDSLKKVDLGGLKAMTPEIKESIADLKRAAESLQKEIEAKVNIPMADEAVHNDVKDNQKSDGN